MRRLKTSILAPLVAASLLQPSFLPAALAGTAYGDHKTKIPAVTAQPDVGPELAHYFNDPLKEQAPSQKEIVRLLRQKIKYVFIIFNENHSFDNEFGTFPGVNGLYSDSVHSRPPGRRPDYQTYTDAKGVKGTVKPFRIGPEQNASVVDTVDHSHPGLARR